MIWLIRDTCITTQQLRGSIGGGSNCFYQLDVSTSTNASVLYYNEALDKEENIVWFKRIHVDVFAAHKFSSIPQETAWSGVKTIRHDVFIVNSLDTKLQGLDITV